MSKKYTFNPNAYANTNTNTNTIDRQPLNNLPVNQQMQNVNTVKYSTTTADAAFKNQNKFSILEEEQECESPTNFPSLASSNSNFPSLGISKTSAFTPTWGNKQKLNELKTSLAETEYTGRRQTSTITPPAFSIQKIKKTQRKFDYDEYDNDYNTNNTNNYQDDHGDYDSDSENNECQISSQDEEEWNRLRVGANK